MFEKMLSGAISQELSKLAKEVEGMKTAESSKEAYESSKQASVNPLEKKEKEPNYLKEIYVELVTIRSYIEAVIANLQQAEAKPKSKAKQSQLEGGGSLA